MAAPLKISARVEIDASAAKQGAAASVTAVDSIGAAAERNTTKLQALINTSVGLKSGVANQNVREWTGALAMQGKSIDELRAKYNPLFATLGQYKTALSEIRTLHAQGVLSTNEMTAAIQRQRQAALASIDAIKGRSQALRAAPAEVGTGRNFAATNAMFQFQDIAMTAAMGMNPGMIAMQQGSQLAGAFAGMGLKEAAATTGAALSAMVNPVSLVAIGLTGAAAAAIQLGSGLFSSKGEAEKLDQVVERHSKTVEMLAERWGDVLERASKYGQRSSAAIGFSVDMSTAQLRKSLRDQVPDVLSSITSSAGEHLGEIGGARAFREQPMFGLLTDEVSRLVEAARNGSPDIVGLSRRISELARESNNGGVRKLADDVVLAIGPIEELARKLQEADRYKTQLFNSVGPNGMVVSRGLITQADDYAAVLFESRERVAADRQRKALEAELASLNARSPAEQAEAARRSAAAQYPDETAAARRQRIDEAGTLALVRAEKQLSDARQERSRSLDLTLAQQQLELSLIGKTVGEQERLRMAWRLTSELKAEAARNGTEVDAAELARVQKLSAEYGRLAEQMAARRALDGQDQELEALRVRLALVGQTDDVRTRAIANLETERRLRELGISLGSREADQYREKARLIAEQTEQLRKQEAAWEKVRSTGENTIDTLFDRALDGDWKGALEDIAKDWSKTILQLGAANPMKNALLGTSLPTMDDIGGLGGMFSKLFGGGMSTASMEVTAAAVSVNGGLAGGVGSLLGANDNFKANTTLSALLGYGGAANDNGTGAGGALAFIGNYKSGVDARLTDILSKAASSFPGYKVDAISGFRAGDPRFHGKGLATDVQLTDLLSGRQLGNYQDARSFGAYERFAQTARSIQMRDYPELADQFRWGGYFGGGKGKYGALDTMHFDLGGGRVGMAGGSWEHGLTSAQRSLWSGIESKGTAAVTALNKLAGQSDVAASGLGSLGSGLDKFGSALTTAQPFDQFAGGGLGKLFGTLFSPQYRIAASGGIGLYDGGGYTGPGGIHEPRGVVHAGEIVWSQANIARAGGPAVVEAMRLGLRGYASGGGVDIRPAYAGLRFQSATPAAAPGRNAPIINNYGNNAISYEEETDEHGNRQPIITVGEPLAAAIKQRGNPARQAMQSEFGLRPRRIAR